MTDLDLTNALDVVELMGRSKSASEWNDNCDRVKDANGGYPSFWYTAIVLSQVAESTAKLWGGDAKIHVVTLRR